MANRTSKPTRRPQGLSPAEILEWHGWDVHPETGCWEWRGHRDRKGYGVVKARRLYGASDEFVHRISYAVHNGPIPGGLIVRHKCDNPPCMNPGHLLVGTNRDNSQDMAERKRQHYQVRTHCKRSHDLTLPDAYYVQWMLKPTGDRVQVNRCRLCYEAAKEKSRDNRRVGPKPPRTHCHAGHELTPDNTYTSPKGYKTCRECKNAQWRERYHRLRASNQEATRG